ncbi:type II toxin-antitoxin system VapC family toxin [archaeon]|nr:type II toxin-antitoxin system VapC family toxin [archaeon]
MQRVYLDSNVVIAFVRTEIGKPFKLMFQDVEDFLSACPEKYVLVLSDHACDEINNVISYSKESIIEILARFEIIIEQVKRARLDSEKTLVFAKRGMHYADALHAALAINSKCDILLTFNKKDFGVVNGLINVKEPNELIY